MGIAGHIALSAQYLDSGALEGLNLRPEQPLGERGNSGLALVHRLPRVGMWNSVKLAWQLVDLDAGRAWTVPAGCLPHLGI